MTDTIFLETTIQADRNFSYYSKRKEIAEKLKGKKLVSSSYVLGEIKSNFLQNAITFYNLLQECETTNEALARLSSPVLHSTRQYDRVLKIFSCLTEDGNMSKRNVEKRLNMLIEDGFVSRFFRDLDEKLINETECFRAKVNPEYEDGFWKPLKFNCTARAKNICNICAFFESNSEKIKAIEEVCEKENNKNLTEMASILKEIREENKKPQGKRCWKLGDVIICNELPTDCKIYTTNKKDYEPICGVIGKELYK